MLLARILVVSLLVAVPAAADVIPGATNIFRGATGTTAGSFAMPGNVLEVRVRPAVCDGESIGFVDLPSGAKS